MLNIRIVNVLFDTFDNSDDYCYQRHEIPLAIDDLPTLIIQFDDLLTQLVQRQSLSSLNVEKSRKKSVSNQHTALLNRNQENNNNNNNLSKIANSSEYNTFLDKHKRFVSNLAHRQPSDNENRESWPLHVEKCNSDECADALLSTRTDQTDAAAAATLPEQATPAAPAVTASAIACECEFALDDQCSLSTDVALSLASTRCNLVSQTSKLVNCIGCRTSMERLYKQLVKHSAQKSQPTKIASSHFHFYPFRIESNGTLALQPQFLFDPLSLYSLFYVHCLHLELEIDRISKCKKTNRRCNLHSLDYLNSSSASGGGASKTQYISGNVSLVHVSASEPKTATSATNQASSRQSRSDVDVALTTTTTTTITTTTTTLTATSTSTATTTTKAATVVEVAGSCSASKSSSSHFLLTDWIFVWNAFADEASRLRSLIIDTSKLFLTLNEYLHKHKFCTDCKMKVMKAYHLLVGDIDATKEKGYSPTLYEGMRCCSESLCLCNQHRTHSGAEKPAKATTKLKQPPQPSATVSHECSPKTQTNEVSTPLLKQKHLHLDGNKVFVSNLIARAELEIQGSHRERHAKTLDLAQEEVLTCVGIYLYSRFHRIYQALKLEEQTLKLFFFSSVHTMRKCLELEFERLQGISSIELICAEIEALDESRELRKQLKKQKRKRRKQPETGVTPHLSDQLDHKSYQQGGADDDDNDDEEQPTVKQTTASSASVSSSHTVDLHTSVVALNGDNVEPNNNDNNNNNNPEEHEHISRHSDDDKSKNNQADGTLLNDACNESANSATSRYDTGFIVNWRSAPFNFDRAHAELHRNQHNANADTDVESSLIALSSSAACTPNSVTTMSPVHSDDSSKQHPPEDDVYCSRQQQRQQRYDGGAFASTIDFHAMYNEQVNLANDQDDCSVENNMSCLITDEEKNEYYANKSLYLRERLNRRETLEKRFQTLKLNANFKIKRRNRLQIDLDEE